MSPTLAITNHITDESLMRMLVDALVGGRRGPLGPLDLRVQALLTPGAGFRVSTGRFVGPVVSRAIEGYFAAVVQEESVTGLDGTGSAGGRHDLVVMRTNDPSIPGPGAITPADVERGPYSFIEVIQGVPFYTATFAALGELYSAVEIARIEYGANQATIGGGTGNAKIVDLRPGAASADPTRDSPGTPPAASNQYQMRSLRGGDTEDDRLPIGGVVKTWPARTVNWAPFTIPAWATRMSFEFDVEGALLYGGTVSGSTYVQIGTANNTDATSWVFPVGGQPIQKRTPGGGDYAVPAALRGKTVAMTLKALMLSSSTGTYLRFGPGGYAKLGVFFYADAAA